MLQLCLYVLYHCVQICTRALVTLQRHLWAWQANSGSEVPGVALIH